MISSYKTIFLLSGLAYSGKSTVANYISSKLKIRSFSLGSALKKVMVEISNLFGQPMKYEDLFDAEKKIKYRKQMQTLGTDILRNMLDKDIFNNALKNEISQTILNKESFIIDDIRFKNEYEFWTKYAEDNGYNCISIRITRNKTSLSESEKQHISEQLEGINFMFEIENNDTLGNLFTSTDLILLNY